MARGGGRQARQDWCFKSQQGPMPCCHLSTPTHGWIATWPAPRSLTMAERRGWQPGGQTWLSRSALVTSGWHLLFAATKPTTTWRTKENGDQVDPCPAVRGKSRRSGKAMAHTMSQPSVRLSVMARVASAVFTHEFSVPQPCPVISFSTKPGSTRSAPSAVGRTTSPSYASRAWQAAPIGPP